MASRYIRASVFTRTHEKSTAFTVPIFPELTRGAIVGNKLVYNRITFHRILQ